MLADVVSKSLRTRLAEAPVLSEALRRGQAPLAEHVAVFNMISAVNRDVAEGIRQARFPGAGRWSARFAL